MELYSDLPPAGGVRGGQWAHFLGAAVSVALVAGIAVWGYRLAVRDVSGVPVVRAMEGPMRIAPDNPGGEVTAHQGLAVNSVAAEGTAAPPADTLVLAPPPVDLTPEDVAPAAPEAVLIDVTAPAPDQATLVELAVAEALAESAVPLSGEIGAEPALGEAPPDAPVLASIRPRARPMTAEVPAGEPVPAPVAVREVDAGAIAEGTRLVQLGAFDTAEAARTEWDRLSRRFGAVLADKGRVVMAAQSGGRAFFRLRAEGFADEADARRFCAVLLAENASCVAVTQR